nr:hypothetical protein [Kutzneria sp. 744]
MNRVWGTAMRSVVARLPSPRSLVEHDAGVVEGDVGELRAAVDVAEGEDVGLAGAEVLVDHDGAVGRGADGGGVEPEAGGDGAAAGGRENGGGLDGVGRPVLCVHNLVVGDLDDPSAGDDLDAVAGQDFRDDGGDVGVLAGQQLVGRLDHRDVGAEVPVDGGELQAEVAAADDHQAPGEVGGAGEFGAADQERAVGQAGDRRQDGLGAGVDQDRRRGHGDPVVALADGHGVRVEEGRGAGDHGRGVLAVERLEVAGTEGGGQLADAGDGVGEELLRVVLQPSRVRVVHQHFRRHTADVGAGAAVHVLGPFDQDHAAAGVGERVGGGLAALAEADDQHVRGEGSSHAAEARPSGVIQTDLSEPNFCPRVSSWTRSAACSAWRGSGPPSTSAAC